MLKSKSQNSLSVVKFSERCCDQKIYLDTQWNLSFKVVKFLFLPTRFDFAFDSIFSFPFFLHTIRIIARGQGDWGVMLPLKQSHLPPRKIFSCETAELGVYFVPRHLIWPPPLWEIWFTLNYFALHWNIDINDEIKFKFYITLSLFHKKTRKHYRYS